MTFTLACGPYIPLEEIGRSLLLLCVAKPITYAMFALAFRYRVSTPRPLGLGRIALVVFLRTLLGVAVLVTGALVLQEFDGTGSSSTGWAILAIERAGIWALLGFALVGLRGRRLAGWILSGTGIDLAFDFAVFATFRGSWWESWLVVAAMIAFLVPLYRIGRRPSLRSRFLAAHLCRTCGYDLTGNVSGVCPECGTTTAPLCAAP